MTSYGESNHDTDRPSLSMNERIVWISDHGPEYGNVRWLGKLPDLGKEWMAGVEFDNPVGSGTGLYRDRQLFITPLNHASLVPIIGLLKASDFEPPRPPARTSSINLINIDQEIEFDDSKKRDIYNFDDHITHRDLDNDYLQYRESPHTSNRLGSSTHASKSTSQRVHNIPIRLEADEEPRLTSTRTSNYTSKKPSIPTKPNKLADGTYSSNTYRYPDNIDDLTTTISKASLNERQLIGCLPLLPQPAWVVAANEKNPNLALKDLLGKSRGIQGHNNSCYLDATLFAMFSSTTLFDSLLYRPANTNDIPEYPEIQRILREEIVRPLRDNHIVHTEQVMLFRTMLERSSTVAGLTDEEKDPEEFLSLLLSQILKAEPYLKLSSGLESFFYQLIVDKDESVVLPTVQDLFQQSFMNSTVRLREIPPCLLLQMPRFGRQYKMYSRIMPSLKLDITDVLEAVPRACGHRGKDCDNLARYECSDCFGERSGRHNARLSTITYCNNCFQAKHFGKTHSTGIEGHDKTKTVLDKIPPEAVSRYSNKASTIKDRDIPRVCMDLFAVLCIETSHYVCFVKCGQDPDAPWCFFDSMADRRGEQNGYNIPEVLLFDDFSFWTSDKGVTYLLNHRDDKLLPEMARRIICDAYLCFYQYPGLTTYR